jgi:hypothetical protein
MIHTLIIFPACSPVHDLFFLPNQMKSPSLVLHIGTPKTGTTSIQDFLYSHRREIAACGIGIPQILGLKNHRWLAFIVRDSNKDKSFAAIKGISVGQLETAKKSKADELRAYVKSSEYSKHVITSEFLAALNQREIRRLKILLEDMFNDIKILIYIRNPLGMAISAMSERLKRGDSLSRLPSPSEIGLADHKKLILKWREAFGGQNVIVRLLEKDFLLNGKLIDDFSAQIGIDNLAVNTELSMKNQALSFTALKILSYVNHVAPAFLDGRPNQLRKRLITELYAHFSLFPKYCPSKEEHNDYFAYFNESREWLQEVYFPSRHHLWSVIPFRSDSGSSETFALTDVERAFVDIMLRLLESGPFPHDA